MIDPVSLSGLIVAVIGAVGELILGVLKVIKKSSCFWDCFKVETVET